MRPELPFFNFHRNFSAGSLAKRSRAARALSRGKGRSRAKTTKAKTVPNIVSLYLKHS